MKSGVFFGHSHSRRLFVLLAVLPFIFHCLGTLTVFAAEASYGFNGSQPGLICIAPLIGILLSVAFFSSFLADFWDQHYSKVYSFWAIAFLVSIAVDFGVSSSIDKLPHTILLEYMPFIILIGSLLTIAGGTFVGCNIHGSPLMNAMLEAVMRIDHTANRAVSITGFPNFILLVLLIGAVLMGSSIDIGSIHVRNFDLPVASMMRDLILVGLAWVSIKITPDATREANRLNREQVLEGAKLFGGIFVTVIPAIAILRVGESGVVAPLLEIVTNADNSPNIVMYFWIAGLISSFLDNAPTFLIFFNSASGNPDLIQASLANTLLAISAGAVFMGANTYIGNAPNFMVKSVAERNGVPMPSFSG